MWFFGIWFGTFYVITGGYLIIKRGPFKKKIDLYTIHKIEKNHMISAGIALSIERYTLYYGESNTAIIAPKNIDQLVNEIEKETNNKIEFYG
ncbi:hypothetical protein DT065_14645 [Salicibibacter kimchii]|uniref:Uncharacterized protein YyaB-like PH domain-containing protein n=2 Tax=Salicibibacter kimchii TaxID=2099786 RepID=A0A345C1N3_9BACI|nr:hypothetical protein DT065_14645 [Salicibibacter kimchii]